MGKLFNKLTCTGWKWMPHASTNALIKAVDVFSLKKKNNLCIPCYIRPSRPHKPSCHGQICSFLTKEIVSCKQHFSWIGKITTQNISTWSFSFITHNFFLLEWIILHLTKCNFFDLSISKFSTGLKLYHYILVRFNRSTSEGISDYLHLISNLLNTILIQFSHCEGILTTRKTQRPPRLIKTQFWLIKELTYRQEEIPIMFPRYMFSVFTTLLWAQCSSPHFTPTHPHLWPHVNPGWRQQQARNVLSQVRDSVLAGPNEG